MKKILSLAVAVSFFLFGCSNGSRQKSNAGNMDSSALQENGYSKVAVIDSLRLEWTGYKTTSKTPVKGVFNTLTLEGEDKSGKTPREVLDGATATATVASLFSDNEERDSKLIKIFFGAMNETPILKAALHFKDNKPYLSITMNGVTKDIEVADSFENNIYTLEGNMKLSDFNAQKALQALNKACLDLHKGADGISKTWDDVHFKGAVYFAPSFGK